ncbi:MAG: protein translocase subunit SecF [Clostridia bacterium]|nr:protein translocase subunit SecF [Clostridia bacterium]
MLNFNFKDKNLKIVQKFWIFLIVSAVIIVAGLVDTFFVRHMNLGVEFEGGVSIDVNVSGVAVESGKIEEEVISWLKGGNEKKDVFEVDGTVQKSGVGLKTLTFRISSSKKDANGKVVNLNVEGADNKLEIVHTSDYIKDSENGLPAHLREVFGEKAVIDVETQVISESQANVTVRRAFIAVGVAVAVILVYIALRFNLLAGVSAIVALIHDVLIMVAFTTIFQLPVNMTFIAAIITIVGYSINATIVVFDRIRELHVLPSNIEKTDVEIANEAITGTLSRSILTTLTTLVMIVILAIFGSTAIRDFALPIIFGLLAGAYSSVLLSAPLWVKLRKLFKQENKKPVKKIKKIKEQAKA